MGGGAGGASSSGDVDDDRGDADLQARRWPRASNEPSPDLFLGKA